MICMAAHRNDATLPPKYEAGIRARCVHQHLYRTSSQTCASSGCLCGFTVGGSRSNNIHKVQWGCSKEAAPPPHPPLSIPWWDLPSSGLGGPGALLAWKCARKWGPCFSGAPTGRHRLSPLKNQRDEEEQRPAGTMRSRLPRTACLLRLFALCILLAHSAAYFGSVSLWALRPVFDSIVCFLLWKKGDCVNLVSAGHCYARVILLIMRVCIVVQFQKLLVVVTFLQTLDVGVLFQWVHHRSQLLHIFV